MFIMGTGKTFALVPDVFIEGEVECTGSSFCRGEGDAEDGVGTEFFLGRRAIELEYEAIDRYLIAGVDADEFGSDDGLNILHRF